MIIPSNLVGSAPLIESTLFPDFQKWKAGTALTPSLFMSLEASVDVSPTTLAKKKKERETKNWELEFCGTFPKKVSNEENYKGSRLVSIKYSKENSKVKLAGRQLHRFQQYESMCNCSISAS